MLQIRGISKAFPNVQALNDVSFDVHSGEILALVGENGAGKSTLLKILNGDYQPDAGTLTFDHRTARFASPLEAHRAGVRVIYQEPEIIPGVDVAENIWAGQLPLHRGLVDRRRLRAQVTEELARYGFDRALPLRLMGDELSSAQRQLVEIMRALKSGLRLLALDEPTSSLTIDDVDRLFALVRRLRSEGVAVIYVSHRIKEILDLADRVAVMRDGRMVAVRPASELTEGEIIRRMVGRAWVGMSQRRRPPPTNTVVLRAEGIQSAWHHDVTFEIRSGEVVGLAGLVGSGRTELAKVIFGDLPRDGGRVLVDGSEADIHQPGDAVRVGLGFTPEDRKREGLILARSLLENVSLATFRTLSRFHIVERALERRVVSEYVNKLRIRPANLEQEVGKLSGGNQQKVIVARWLSAQPKVLILDEPTRGIDVGAKGEIYRLIDGLASQGLGILFISSELPELLSLSDRIYVMQHGRITGEIPGEEATEEKILALAITQNPAASDSVPSQATVKGPTA